MISTSNQQSFGSEATRIICGPIIPSSSFGEIISHLSELAVELFNSSLDNLVSFVVDFLQDLQDFVAGFTKQEVEDSDVSNTQNVQDFFDGVRRKLDQISQSTQSYTDSTLDHNANIHFEEFFENTSNALEDLSKNVQKHLESGDESKFGNASQEIQDYLDVLNSDLVYLSKNIKDFLAAADSKKSGTFRRSLLRSPHKS